MMKKRLFNFSMANRETPEEYAMHVTAKNPTTNRFLLLMMVGLTIAILAMVSHPVLAENGRLWTEAGKVTTAWTAGCELCPAETGEGAMSGCVATATQMTVDRPYIGFRASPLAWCHSAPGTESVTPGQKHGQWAPPAGKHWMFRD